jgi:hypothetical protein
MGPRHGVKVNDYLQSVSNPAVFAAGDAAASAGPPLTPIATYEGAEGEWLPTQPGRGARGLLRWPGSGGPPPHPRRSGALPGSVAAFCAVFQALFLAKYLKTWILGCAGRFRRAQMAKSFGTGGPLRRFELARGCYLCTEVMAFLCVNINISNNLFIPAAF